MVFSIICVYNDYEQFKNNIYLYLTKIGEKKIEIVPIDNTNNKHSSAAEALNYGASIAIGKYLVFVHQDVHVLSEKFIDDLLTYLSKISNLGITGCIGINNKGEITGFIRDRDIIVGQPTDEIQDVESIDECLLIVDREIFLENGGFDEVLGGWHCYSVDFCIRMHKIGKRVCVLPIFIWHDSLSTNILNLIKIQKKVKKKHNVTKVYTTSGVISNYGFLKTWLRYYIPNNIKNLIIRILTRTGYASDEYLFSQLLMSIVTPGEKIGVFKYISSERNINKHYKYKAIRFINNKYWPEYNINYLFLHSNNFVEFNLYKEFRVIIIENKLSELVEFKLVGYKCIKKLRSYKAYIKECSH